MFGNLPSVQLTSFGARQTECRVHKRDMGKGLGEIAEEAARAGVIFLRQQANVVRKRDEPLEKATGFLQSAKQDVVVGQPEATGEECPFSLWQAIEACIRFVAQDQSIENKVLRDRRYRVANPLIAGRKEAHNREEEQACIKAARAISLNEVTPATIDAVATDVAVDASRQLPPSVSKAFRFAKMAGIGGAPEGEPRHDLGVCEVLGLAPDFPNAVVWLAPDLFKMLEPRNGEINETGDRGQTTLASDGEGIRNLTIDIELELARRGVADSHGARSSMTGKPWDFPLVEVPLTREAIHDLHLVGTASHSSKQPIAPSLRFVAVPSVHQG